MSDAEKKINAKLARDEKYAQSFDGTLKTQFKQHNVGAFDRKSRMASLGGCNPSRYDDIPWEIPQE